MKDKTDKKASCGEKEEKQLTTEPEPPIKTITQKMVTVKKVSLRKDVFKDRLSLKRDFNLK